MYDVIWANGSLINVPFEFARAECMKILPHLKPGGRWIELCYPRERWVHEGRLPFAEWGKVTDGERTPWVEWYDLVKIKRRLFPAPLEVVLDFNFNGDAYNWFDLMLASDEPFDAKRKIVDVDIFALGSAPVAHGDATIFANMPGDKIGVTTPEALWSYAVSFDLSAAAAATDDSASLNDGFTIEVDLRVSQGRIGILLVGDDLNAPRCREHMIAAQTEPATLSIDVPPQAGGNRLVFRNTAAGTRSQFELQRIVLRFLGRNGD